MAQTLFEPNVLINPNSFNVSVVMHELGHVLGLADNGNTSSVMCWINNGSTNITSDDLNDLDTLY